MTVKQALKAPQTDDDRHLSDHEWRLKMAAEGRALYVPGKTVEEVKAQLGRHAAEQERQVSATISLSQADLSATDTALPDTLDLLRDLGELCLFLSDFSDLDQPAINSMLRLAGRAARGAEHRDVAVLERLDQALRSARADRAGVGHTGKGG